MRKRSIKNTRVNTEVQRELSSIIRSGIKDPRVAPWTSVVAAEVAPDLKTCKAYISVLGDEEEQKQLPEIWERAVEAVKSFGLAGIERTMTQFNRQ